MSHNQPTTAHTAPESLAPELTLVETLRVLEIARGMQQERSDAAMALARHEIRQVMRKRLLDAAAITGDSVTESDVDAAIDHYFATQHSFADPPMSVTVFLAHLYVRRGLVFLIVSGIAGMVLLRMFLRH